MWETVERFVDYLYGNFMIRVGNNLTLKITGNSVNLPGYTLTAKSAILYDESGSDIRQESSDSLYSNRDWIERASSNIQKDKTCIVELKTKSFKTWIEYRNELKTCFYRYSLHFSPL